MASNNTWQIFLYGTSSQIYILEISQECTTEGLQKLVAKRINYEEDSFYLAHQGKNLNKYEKTQKLSELDVRNESNIYVMLRLHGGKDPSQNSQNDVPETRHFRELPGYVTLTTEMCMITCECEADSQNAKMPCGHVIGWKAMLTFAKSQIDQGKCDVICPDPSCDEVWPFFVVRHVACLTRKECEELENKIMLNYSQKESNIKQCPVCNAYLYHEPLNKDLYTECPWCKREEGQSYKPYCWSCQRTWKNSRFAAECGNAACKGGDLYDYLKNCGTTQIYSKECPVARACPKCHRLIHHEAACKHMTCPCGHRFCFVCLKPRTSNGWQCGSYSDPCEVAAVQKSL